MQRLNKNRSQGELTSQGGCDVPHLTEETARVVTIIAVYLFFAQHTTYKLIFYILLGRITSLAENIIDNKQDFVRIAPSLIKCFRIPYKY